MYNFVAEAGHLYWYLFNSGGSLCAACSGLLTSTEVVISLWKSAFLCSGVLPLQRMHISMRGVHITGNVCSLQQKLQTSVGKCIQSHSTGNEVRNYLLNNETFSFLTVKLRHILKSNVYGGFNKETRIFHSENCALVIDAQVSMGWKCPQRILNFWDLREAPQNFLFRYVCIYVGMYQATPNGASQSSWSPLQSISTVFTWEALKYFTKLS